MKLKTTRQQIIEYIERRQIATADDIRQVMHMTSANARHHLSILREEGVIFLAGYRFTNQRGRPRQLYRLSALASQHNLHGLANVLLLELNKDSTTDDIENLMRSVARKIYISTDINSLARSPNLTQRLFVCKQILDQMSYNVRWEAHAKSPRIILGQCPYVAIASQHPELCQMDAYLLEEIVQAKIIQDEKLESNSLGMPQCVFRIVDQQSSI